MKFNKLISFSFLVLFLISFSFMTACDNEESSRSLNPLDTDSEPMPTDNDDPVSTPPDSTPPDDGGGGGGTPGGGGGTGGGGSGPAPPPMDDPNPPATGTGVIRGTVQSSGGTDLNGVHVRAVNVDDPNIQVSSFSGIDCDLDVTNTEGMFCIQNIPPGTYRVLIERLDARNQTFVTTRYSQFILDNATTLVFPDEYWNGAGESATDDPMDIETVVVTNGGTVNGIDFVTND